MAQEPEKQLLSNKDAEKKEKEKEGDVYIKKGRLMKIIKMINPESHVRIGKNVIRRLNQDVNEIIDDLIFVNLEYDEHTDSFTFVANMTQSNSSVPTTLLPNTFGKCIKEKLMVAFPSVKKVNALFINQLHHLIEDYLVKLIEYYINSMGKRTTLSVETMDNTNKNIKLSWYKDLFLKSNNKLKHKN